MEERPRGRVTRVDEIVEAVKADIAGGVYALGDRLAPVRAAALSYGVSKNTMAEAYDRLVSEGFLRAVGGSGYYAARSGRDLWSAPPPHFVEATDAVSLLREQLDPHFDVRPGDGRPPPSWMETSELRRHFSAFRGGGDVDFGYGSTEGFAPLRDRLRQMLAERMIAVEPGGLLLTHGANHALDLVIRHFLEPGDTVFVDEPGYYPLFAKLTLAKVRMVGIRRGADGPDLEDLFAKLPRHRPKLFFTQSQAQNPTGTSLTPAVAFALLQASESWGFRIVEDDAFGDIVPPGMPRLAALGRLDRVVYVGSFSKTLSASLRTGYIAAHPSLLASLRDIKMVTGVATSDFVERFVLGLIEGGHYLRHLRRLRTRLAKEWAATLAGLDQLELPARQTGSGPNGLGYYLWLALPPSTDEAELCRRGAARGIFIAPGSVFYPDREESHPPAIRINVAYGADPRFIAFLSEALGVSKS
ncbi:PLP-dependent aminotransferase family protein [Aureimonas mangrovi]|uniref:aminotransferase-like domain-containing protein n=1 Tax=Aureimonas mangrovi TaxID=2758041 RepID=UPI00163D7F56|nr:PLP-dependent aminotransferase family protein [Aureimonas mangrovi]